MTPLKHWRSLLLGVLALAAFLAIAAFGDDDNASTTPTGTAGTPAASGATDNRQQGGVLKVQGLNFQSLDPHYSNFVQDISIDRFLWRGLYSMDIDNKPQPAMAASAPTISADGKTYTIKLKSGLKWSDGQPMTAKDFEAGLKRTCNPVIAGNYEALLDASIVGCSDLFAALGTADAPVTKTPAEPAWLPDGET